MAKVISQETFDDVVKENVVEFAMSVQEAKEETVKQFEAQGINLANIIKDLSINEETGNPVLTETIEKLKTISAGDDVSSDQVPKLLEILSKECTASVPHRVMAAKLGAEEIISKIIDLALEKQEITDTSVIKTGLIAWNEVMNKQPDIFNDKSLFIIVQILNKNLGDEFILLCLQHLKHATLLHEINRQNIMSVGILSSLKPLLKTQNPEVLKETCSLLRNLILDDDIRIEFSKAHDHARAIAAEFLVELSHLLPIQMKDKNILSELLLTIAALTVRHEFCVQVEEAGGLKFIRDCMKEHSSSIRVSKEALKLMRALAGNDAVKNNILKDGMSKLLDEIINIHKANEPFARAALHCLSTITLRSKENSQLLFDAGIAETIVETMKLHPTSKIVQRNGAWAIRNMVSRSREQCPAFLSHDVEEILKQAMETYSDVQYDLKAALRDLGCEVQLKEEWTGVKNKIHIEN
ncbi:armadillo repeat-containing protein 6 homolog [Sitodiplosis mosellana]|uniref:armadillo repeat-containing protein 6 homolog n=1 Tax=Sitodiplosis mosellana TaxID=263140 RepID=UPI0024440542|nr:armadillo repeat-containing protein 6 homolog [Sitodiplosis mosellana]